jgi:hypothetical protein
MTPTAHYRNPIWMRWFIGEGDAPNRLDAILFETLDELRPAREAEDRPIVDFVEGSTIGVSPGRSNTATSHRRKNSSNNWVRRWRIGSTTRPTTAVKSTLCRLVSSARRRNPIS